MSNDECTNLDDTIPYDYEVNEADTSKNIYEALTWRNSTLHCCWGECKTDTRYPEKSPPGTFFIPFQKLGRFKKKNMTEWENNRENERSLKCKRWVIACGREGFTTRNVKKDTYICSLHFEGGKGPTTEHPDPIKAGPVSSHNKSSRKRKSPSKRGSPQKKKRRTSKGVKIETDHVPTTTANADSHNIPTTCSNDDSYSMPTTSFSDDCQQTQNTSDPLVDFYVSKKKDKCTQTIYDKYILGAQIETIILKNQVLAKPCDNNDTKEKAHGNMSIEVILLSEKVSKYFTGLFPGQFWALYRWLGPAKHNLNYWGSKSNKTKERNMFSVSEELLITLIRLRRGYNVFTLAHLYGTSETFIRKIFTTWIMYLFHHFKDYKFLMFPERNALRIGIRLPKVFRKFKNIRASIDCTEFFCEVPRDYAQQGNMYSSYKHHTTMKCLIAVNPHGGGCFISDMYEGSISDEAIFEDCGFLEHVNIGDTFLVDKGFNVKEKLLSKQATIYIPPRLKTRLKFNKEEVIQTKRIAKARIHVERFNERLKKFRLIGGVIPLILRPLASQLVYVASCLVNFQDSLCK